MPEANIVWNPDDLQGTLPWAVERALQKLSRPGGAIVSPTKVGYIIMTKDRAGLDRKFDLKNRPTTKPGVVLCSSLEQLRELAEVDEKILALYQECWDKDILLGSILNWKPGAAEKYIPDDGSIERVQDPRHTSCFVIKFGTPSEMIAKELWAKSTLAFASSANPSGTGNRGQLEGVGERILSGVDLAIDADDYVRSQQPERSVEERHEQGVMVSMVEESGRPTLIRNGLDLEKIKHELDIVYGEDGWDHKHGHYH